MINRFLSEKVTHWQTSLFIIGVVILLFSPYLFRNPAPLIYPVSELGTDLEREILPTVQAVIDGIKESGTIPLWATYHLSGRTLVGHPIAPLFYPPNWLLLALPLELGLNWLLVLHFAWMGIGFYFFLTKGLGKPILASLIVSLLFVFTPKWIAHVSGGHWWMIAALAWWPWVLYAYHRWKKDHRFTWIFLVAVALSAQFLCHIPIFLTSIITLFIITLLSFDYSFLKLNIGKLITFWALVGLLFLCITAIHWMPTIELEPYIYRADNGSTFTSLPPAALLTAFIPSTIQYPELVIYPGIGLLFFAGINGASLWKDRVKRKWLWIFVIGLLLSLGEYTPLYNLIFGWNPGISLLRIPCRWWLLVITALAVLSAYALERIEIHVGVDKRKLLIYPIILLILNAAALTIRLLLGDQIPFAPAWTVGALLIISLLLILIIPPSLRISLIGMCCLFESALIGFTMVNPVSIEEITALTPLETRLASLLDSDERYYAPLTDIATIKNVTAGFMAIDGYDYYRFDTYTRLLKNIAGCAYMGEAPPAGMTVQESNQNCFQGQVHYDRLAMLNVRYLVLPTSITISDQYNTLYSDNLNKIIELPRPFGRAFSPQEVRAVTENNCLTTLGQINPEKTTLITGNTNLVTSSGKIKIIESSRSVNGETFLVDGSAEAFLVRSEVWAPGWKAMIDDQPATVLQANCALQGVWVPQGMHTITFKYYPDGYKYGKWISISSLIILVIYVMMRVTILKRNHL